MNSFFGWFCCLMWRLPCFDASFQFHLKRSQNLLGLKAVKLVEILKTCSDEMVSQRSKRYDEIALSVSKNVAHRVPWTTSLIKGLCFISKNVTCFSLQVFPLKSWGIFTKRYEIITCFLGFFWSSSKNFCTYSMSILTSVCFGSVIVAVSSWVVKVGLSAAILLKNDVQNTGDSRGKLAKKSSVERQSYCCFIVGPIW